MESSNLKNGLGLAYRALETDNIELNSKWEGGEVRLLASEIEHKLSDIEKVEGQISKLKIILEKFKQIAKQND